MNVKIGRAGIWLWGCFLLSLSVLSGAGIRFGMEPIEVEAELGRPTSRIERSGRMMWLYPDNGRVDFENGRVVDMRDVAIDDGKAPAPPPLTAEPAASSAEQIAAEEALAAEQAAERAQQAAYQQAYDQSQAELAAGIEGLTDSRAQAPAMMSAQFSGGAHFYGKTAVGFLLQCLIAMVALRLSFKWNDVDSEWKQLAVVAVGGGLAQVLVQVGVYATLGLGDTFYVDKAIALAVMIVMLKQFTHATTWNRAVPIAMFAKVMVTVLWALASVYILNVLF